MKTNEIAQAVKDYIVDLAVNDKLPMDLTQLSTDEIEEVIKSKLPTKEDERIERASHYLCDADDMTIADQLALIDAQAEIDDTVMLDNVEGIIVWEKVEWVFTVGDFLDEIEH
jgi:hypothetical protein